MTTTPIKDLSNIMATATDVATTKAGAASKGSDQFDTLFKNQMKQVPKQMELKKLSQAPVQSVKNSQIDKASKIDRKSDSDDEEKITRNAEETANSFMTQLTEMLGLSEDELREKLEAFGITPTDLLQSDVLGQFFMDLNQITDTTSLLTDEALYSSYQDVFNLLQETMNSMTTMSSKDLANLEALMSAQAQAGEAESLLAEEGTDEEVKPVIEVIRNTPANDGEEADVLIKQEAGREAGKESDSAAADTERNMAFQSQMNQQTILQQMSEQMETSSATAASHVDTQDIMNQIMDYMKVTLDADMDTLEMQLHPASLGTLQIQVTNRGGVMTASFITQNEAVKQALESQMMTLQDSLNQQGLKVEAVEVSVSTNAFDSNLDQGRDEQGKSQSNRGRNRRFRTVSDIQDNLKDMKPQEQLAAKIQSANQKN